MIRPLSALALALLLAAPLRAASPPFTLPLPEGWRAETLPFPLDFAPGIPYEGLEELRFAPGMFDPEAEGYFTYAFVWWVRTPPPFEPDRLARELSEYLRGLAAAVAEGKPGRDPGASDYRARLARVRGRPTRLVGFAEAYDAFTAAAPVTLHVRARLLGTSGDHAAWFFALSPHPLSHPLWDELAGIGDGFAAR